MGNDYIEFLSASRIRMMLILLLSLVKSVLIGKIVPVLGASPKSLLPIHKRRNPLCNGCDSWASGFAIIVTFCKISGFWLSFLE